MRFVDEAEVVVASGKGGDGLVSFRREAKVPRGGPDGGDGGAGGSIVIEASSARNTLVDFRYKRIWRAKDGQAGMKNKMYGAAAPDLVLKVPVGTVVYDAETDERIIDLDQEGASWVLSGGRGGRGNPWFATSTRQTPTFAEPGKPGAERMLRLELKLLADVGLLGFPNAGKSTLVSRISAARPKIADYPFTTLAPQLGVVSLAPGDSFVVADIPGLIEGAAEGRGLGHQFLRHVERCRLYLHLVSPDQPEGDPVECLRILEAEIEAYDPELLDRPRMIVLSKCDLLSDDERERWLSELAAASGCPVFPLSAVSGFGKQELLWAIWSELQALKAAAAEEHASLDPFGTDEDEEVDASEDGP